MRTPLIVVSLGLLLLALGGTDPGAGTAGAMSREDERAAVASVQSFVTMTTHLRGARGDPRFAERTNADPALVEEVLADVAISHHAGREEDAKLVKAEVRSVRLLEAGRVEVRTREYWVTRDLAVKGSDSIRSDVVPVRYLLAGGGTSWRVINWDVDDDAPSAGER